jgi:hypothetical protein
VEGNRRDYAGTCQGGLRKTIESLNQDSRSPGQESKPGTSRIQRRSTSCSSATSNPFHSVNAKKNAHNFAGSYWLKQST